MMMPGRTRLATTARNQGYWQWDFIGDHYMDNSPYTYESTCVDSYKDGGDNMSFLVKRRFFSGMTIDTQEPRVDNDNRSFHNFCCAISGAAPFTTITFPGEDSTSNYASRTAARTNPSRPYVDVPVEVLQLGELTQLIQKRGNSLLKELGRENLRYQFGIKPLVEDVVKLFHFHEQVARRVQELKRLTGPRGLRRTVDLDTLSRVDTPTLTWSSAGSVVFSVPTTITRRCVIKGHTRWITSTDMSKMPTAQIVALAKRAVLGFTIDAATVWELIPFSWLVDWGYNVSAFFYAHRNIVPATLDGLSIIRHETASAVIPPMKIRDHQLKGGTYIIETKQRTPATAFPTAHFPFLSGNQMGILASLAVTRL
jgi:hypothetical protein